MLNLIYVGAEETRIFGEVVATFLIERKNEIMKLWLEKCGYHNQRPGPKIWDEFEKFFMMVVAQFNSTCKYDKTQKKIPAINVPYHLLLQCLHYIEENRVSMDRDEYRAAIFTMAKLAEYDLPEIGNHLETVSGYAFAIAQQLRMNPDYCEAIRLVSLLHDVGKIMIPKEILHKPSRLSEAEKAIIDKHTDFGSQIIEAVMGGKLHVRPDDKRMCVFSAHEHHENYDGSGNNGKLGDNISQCGRIIKIADVLDAVTGVRPYRKPIPFDEGVDWIRNGSPDGRTKSTEFDPYLLKNVLPQCLPQMREVHAQNYG